MALRYQEKVNALVQSLADERHRHQAIELIRGLIDKVVLSPNSKGQELVIDVYGDLAGILNISTDIDCGSLRQEIDFKQIRMIVGLDLPVSGSPQAPDDQPTPKWG